MPTDTPNAEHHTEVRATPARQGRMGRDVFVVLVVSLTLAALAVFGSWAWYSGQLEAGGPGRDSARAGAQASQATEPPRP